ncbi:ribonuclease J [Actinomyces sp. zg-332]|uniref:ribonuclease J n=1 Tax=Actinomyces sp. zg-332 TaxID=2708340 RepID=UPI003FA4499C
MNINDLQLLDSSDLPPSSSLRIIALGGLGEVGRNMTVFEYDSKLLIVDCGVYFPTESHPGVDLILPDFTYVLDRIDKVEALVLTHGHEDHIGAVPYLLKHRGDIPIISSNLTLAFLEAKLEEFGIKNANLITVRETETYDLDSFNLEFVAVNHSIPDAMAIMIRTQAGKVLITGDFKMDQLPLDGRLTDLRAFSNLGQEGVDLFMVDSTNAEHPGFTTHECEITPVLDSCFANATGQIVVASFSSHVHRVQQVIDCAYKHNRKVCLVGRSMIRNMHIAIEEGYLSVPDMSILVDQHYIAELPENQRVYMVTGSQGEPLAALSRIASESHKFVSVETGDTVIFASSLIPGNENKVFRVIDDLTALGVDVVHQAKARVHVSGHAGSGELLYCYNIVKPKNVIPIHGQSRHLIANGRLAEETGVPESNVLYAPNGVVVELKDGVAKRVARIPNEYIYVDGNSIGEIEDKDLQQRLALGSEGVINIVLVVDFKEKLLMAPARVEFKGVCEEKDIFDDVLNKINQNVQKALSNGEKDAYVLQQIARRALGRFLSTSLRRYPVIMPVVIEI